jgi:hypothetical protein
MVPKISSKRGKQEGRSRQDHDASMSTETVFIMIQNGPTCKQRKRATICCLNMGEIGQLLSDTSFLTQAMPELEWKA